MAKTKAESDRVEEVALALLVGRVSSASKVSIAYVIDTCFREAQQFVDGAKRFRATGSTLPPEPEPEPPAEEPDESDTEYV